MAAFFYYGMIIFPTLHFIEVWFYAEQDGINKSFFFSCGLTETESQN